MPSRKIIVQLAIVSFAACFSASPSSERPLGRAEQKTVWTNEDLIALRAISPVIDSESRAASDSPNTAGASARYTKFKDPRWYREKLEPLRAELDATNSELRRLRNALRSGRGGTNGLDLAEDTEGIDPGSQIAILVQRRAELLKQIDTLEDLAQRNEVPPGELRQERSADERAYSAYLEEAAANPPEQKPPQSEAEWRKRFAALHEQLDYAQRELKVLQWEWNSGLVQYYPNPNKALREEYTRREVNALAKKVREKKAEVVQLKQSISDLEDDLRHAGGPPGWARE